MDELTVMGFEGLRRIPRILGIRRRLRARWCADRPDVYIGVDVPDFNLGLEERLRVCGVPTVHYVSPTVWAWRRYRVRQIRRAVDCMLALFPFEAEYYRAHGVPVSFVGHPLADVIPEHYDAGAVRDELGLARDRPIVALLPGSRAGELRRHGALFAGTARWLRERDRELVFVASFANEETRALFAQAVSRCRPAPPPITVLMHRARHVMAAADAVLAASGTATLEAALLKKPMVVTYKVSWLTYALVRAFAHVRHFSLPNNLAGRALVPELLQAEATPAALGAAILRYLEEPARRRETAAALGEIYHALRQNANEKAAEAVAALLGARMAPSAAGASPT